MYRGTRKSIIEIAAVDSGKFVWRKVAPNGEIVAVAGAPFDARRYAAVAGHREYPALTVLHLYGDQRLKSEADAENGNATKPKASKKKSAKKSVKKAKAKKSSALKGARKK